MITLVKYSLFFLAAYLVFAIPCKDKTLFEQVHRSTAKITDPIYQTIGSGFSHGVVWGKQLFTGAAPQKNKITDEVNERNSSIQKDEISQSSELSSEEDLDGYTEQERSMLEDLTR